MELIVEVGFKLDYDLAYYDDVLRKKGLENVFKVVTKDLYYTNKSLDGLTENEMKSACVRIRHCNDDKTCRIQNNVFADISKIDTAERRSEEISFGKRNACTQLPTDNIPRKVIDELVKKEIPKEELEYYEICLKELGYKKIFDTRKTDYHYRTDEMNSTIQLQQIDDIGLMVYFDNSEYYNLPLNEQRIKLIGELNSYGFDFKYEDLGLDKLRTLYYGKEMYSLNQNA